ncbi:hypothetical protein GCM10011613_00950 [Cellvibrio zantedeschiae]|uniref:Solute-binding protein family 3/N-terminal domain-containing protein n=1 Tax=Cellvibrio zantedeschiae TaxID=1237077 RepID=A0ABQ3ALU7_9GAMM|nr:transporter substrate-binding domain-containing protein [Cellvibrio zantedeschiae]GGY61367.1 hypothetical protein GCM10011613_00950 [Cellvibrio zantedeschiae]
MSFISRYNTLRFSLAVLILASLGLSSGSFAETAKEPVVVPPWGGGANSPKDYFYRLLTLALTKTESAYGAAEVVPYQEVLTATRFMADLKMNKTIDVMWHGNSELYERELLAIPISLTKELNEYRVFLIRREDQPRFSTINSLDDLSKFTSGGGADWPSRDIMVANGLPVIGITNTSLLFNMLKAKRFDYVSRSLFEVWGENERFAKEGLALEQTLLIHGGQPFYFFVNKANTALAKRIEEGLRLAIADGSFDELFYSDEGMQRGQQELEHNERKLIKLKYQPRATTGLP